MNWSALWLRIRDFFQALFSYWTHEPCTDDPEDPTAGNLNV